LAGVLLGIARKPRPRAAMEVVEESRLGLLTGVAGDCRGTVRPGRSGRRQVSILSSADWQAALAELGQAIPWQERRANLFVDGLDLPRAAGWRLSIGAMAVLEITGECDPCRRMEAVAAGLEAALTSDWRGGRLARVIVEGDIVVGDPVTLL
jgi:MOSC domain-containing protein YiiM